MIPDGPADEVSMPRPERFPEPGKQRLVLVVMGVLLALDLLSKAWIQGNLMYGQSLELFGDWVRLTYLLNPGAAFGLNVGSPGIVARQTMLFGLAGSRTASSAQRKKSCCLTVGPARLPTMLLNSRCSFSFLPCW